jgi:hypothetical protein
MQEVAPPLNNVFSTTKFTWRRIRNGGMIMNSKGVKDVEGGGGVSL